jgi:hypothetical protein
VYAKKEVVSSAEEEEGSLIIPRANEVDPEPINATQDSVHSIEAQSSSPLRKFRITDDSNVQADALKRRAAVLAKWQSLFAVLRSIGTVRMTVDHYETLRDALRWQSVYLGAEAEALPGIRKIKRRLIPLLREFCFARSDVLELRKRSGGTGKVRVVLPSEWARLDTCTAPLFEAFMATIMASRRKTLGPHLSSKTLKTYQLYVKDRAQLTHRTTYSWTLRRMQNSRSVEDFLLLLRRGNPYKLVLTPALQQIRF